MLGLRGKMRRSKSGLVTSWICAYTFCFLFIFPASLFATGVQDANPAYSDLEPLYLEVMINGQPTNLIASFYRTPDGRIGSRAGELNEIGIKVASEIKPDEIVYLSDIPSLEFEYKEDSQLLLINLVDAQRLAKQYNTGIDPNSGKLTPSGIGLVANYSLFATSRARQNSSLEVDNVSASLDGWLYGPLGRVYGSGIISTDDFSNYELLRLDTTWIYSHVKTSNTYKIGDAISGGLAWTRPIRFGGFQVQKNFGLRPDLIATPLFQTSGSAAVPSTVDIYVGNFKTHSQNVDAGPYKINQIPSLSGAGNARIVVTDATGRQRQTTKPFYISSNLLREGFLDYSLETGFARLNYGTLSNNYSKDFIASGTFRYGATDKFTIEGHLEGSQDLINGGLGASFTLADKALVSMAGSASQIGDDTGYQIYGSFDTQLLGMNIHASSRRSFGEYQDLASITALDIIDTGLNGSARTNSGIAKAFDQFSIGIPLPKLRGGINLSFTHLEDVVNKAANYASVSYSQKIFSNATLSISAYSDLDGFSNSGIYVGLSFPIGEKIYASTGIDSNDGDFNFYASASKAASTKPGSWGWRISDTEGTKSRRNAGITYNGAKTISQLNLHQENDNFGAEGYIDGAVVVADSGVYFANRISDAFAIVDAGEADIPIYLSNNLIGKTNKSGKMLVPGLLSYEENNIRIDTDNLPINASVSDTNLRIIPANGAGVSANFGVRADTRNAIIIFTDKNGKFLPVGASGILANSGEEFIVGYDGRSFLENLSANNNIAITIDDEECNAEFDFTPSSDEQVELGPIICQ